MADIRKDGRLNSRMTTTRRPGARGRRAARRIDWQTGTRALRADEWRGRQISQKLSRLAKVRNAPTGGTPSACAQVASTDTRSSPITTQPTGRARPMIGPSPSMPTIASTMASRGRTRRGQVEDRVLDAAEVQQVLRPAVDGARHHAEQVLETARHARPSDASSASASRRSDPRSARPPEAPGRAGRMKRDFSGTRRTSS